MQFHFVFDEIGCISGYADVFEAIENEILLCFERLGERFRFGGEHEEQIKKALMKFARSDRKKIGISKILPRFTAQKITADLINAKFLITEKSSEQRAQKAREYVTRFENNNVAAQVQQQYLKTIETKRLSMKK